MRAIPLRIIALAMLIATPGSMWGDEFDLQDDGSGPHSFEIIDDASVETEPLQTSPMEALSAPLDSYPDPVVDQVPETQSISPEIGSQITADAPAAEWSVPPATAGPLAGDLDAQFQEALYGNCGGSYGGDGGSCGGGGFGGVFGGGGCGGTCGGGACRGADGDACGWRSGPFIDAWVAGGFTGNTASPENGFNTPVVFNDFSNDYQLNQVYLTFGRAVNRCAGVWDIGGRVDLLYGTDYFFTTARGLETHADGSPHWNSSNGDRRKGGFTYADYGLAMPQVYGEVFAPVASGLSVKIGHFYSILGYESVRAPENFFYSHSYAYPYGVPITHTGVLTDLALGSKLNLQAGWTRGWDNWEDLNGKPNYLFGFTYCPSDVASLAFALTTGREDPAGQNDRTAYSLVYTRRFGALTYVFEHVFGSEANAEFDRDLEPDSAKWYGINQYFFMDMTPNTTAGMRIEWFCDQDNARVLGIPFESAVDGCNYVGVTLGLNWHPTCNVIVRPELRYDYSDVEPFAFDSQGVFDDFDDRDQLLLSIDGILTF